MRADSVVGAAALLFGLYLALTCPSFFSFAARHPSSLGLASLAHLLDAAALEPALVAYYFLLAHGLGERLFGRRLPAWLGAERALFSTALGFGALSLAILALGSALPVNAWTAALLLLAGLPLARPWRLRIAAPRQPLSVEEAAAAALIAAALLAAWIRAAAPPTSWDALSYHLEIPKRWALAGRVGMDTSLMTGRTPVHLQALYLPFIALGRDTAAQMFELGFAALCARGVFLFASRHMTRTAGLLAAAVFCSQPLFASFAGSANTDYAVSFYAFLAVWAFWRWRQDRDRPTLALAALLTGLACATKITGLWLSVALTALFLYDAARRRDRGWPLDLAVLLGGQALAAGAWYGATWIWLGNPVWPYFSRWLGGGEAAQAFYERMKASVTEGVPPTLWNLARLPYLLLAEPGRFDYGPPFLAAPLLGLAAAKRLLKNRAPALPSGLAPVCALFTLVWFFHYQSWRYMLPMFPWACLFAGAQLAWLRGRGRLARAAALLTLTLPAAALMARESLSNELFALAAARPLPPSTQSARERYLSLSLDHYDMYRWIDAHLPADAYLMLIGEVRGYYLRKPYTLGDPLNAFGLDFARMTSPEQLETRLRELGVTHILVNPRRAWSFKGDPAYFAHAEALTKAFLRERAAPVVRINGLELFELRRVFTKS